MKDDEKPVLLPDRLATCISRAAIVGGKAQDASQAPSDISETGPAVGSSPFYSTSYQLHCSKSGHTPRVCALCLEACGENQISGSCITAVIAYWVYLVSMRTLPYRGSEKALASTPGLNGMTPIERQQQYLDPSTNANSAGLAIV